MLELILIYRRRNRKFLQDMRDSPNSSMPLEEDPSTSSSHCYHGNTLPQDRYQARNRPHDKYKGRSLPRDYNHGNKQSRDHQTFPRERGQANYVKVMPDCADCKMHHGCQSTDRLIPGHLDKQNNMEYAIKINDNTIIKIEGEYSNPRDSVEIEEPIYESPKEVQKKVNVLRKCTNAGEITPNNLKVITINPRSLTFRSNDISDVSEITEINDESDV